MLSSILIALALVHLLFLVSIAFKTIPIWISIALLSISIVVNIYAIASVQNPDNPNMSSSSENAEIEYSSYNSSLQISSSSEISSSSNTLPQEILVYESSSSMEAFKSVKMPDGKIWMAENFKDSRGNEYFTKANSICPKGWHLPSDNEWSTMIAALGGESIAGKKIREGDFNAKLKGFKMNGKTHCLDSVAFWRTSDSGIIYYVNKSKNNEAKSLYDTSYDKFEFPIRCVKN